MHSIQDDNNGIDHLHSSSSSNGGSGGNSYEEEETLYSVKWYKDNEEFYRYVPKANPPQQSYRVEGIRVEVRHILVYGIPHFSSFFSDKNEHENRTFSHHHWKNVISFHPSHTHKYTVLIISVLKFNVLLLLVYFCWFVQYIFRFVILYFFFVFGDIFFFFSFLLPLYFLSVGKEKAHHKNTI